MLNLILNKKEILQTYVFNFLHATVWYIISHVALDFIAKFYALYVIISDIQNSILLKCFVIMCFL